MSRVTNGWVLLHKNLLSSEWSNALDAIGKGILCELLLMANFEDSEKPLFKHKNVRLKRGQLATSDHELCAQLHVSRKVLRHRLEVLQNMGTITLKRDNHGTIITICNYAKYQDVKNNQEHPRDIQGYNQRTSKGTHNKELKEINEFKEGGTYAASRPLVNRYYERYEALYKILPSGGRNNAVKLYNLTGVELGVRIIDAYFDSTNPYYLERNHPWNVLLMDIDKLHLKAERGIEITKEKAKLVSLKWKRNQN